MLPYEHPPAAPPPALLFKKRFFPFLKALWAFLFYFKKNFFKPISDKRD